MITRIAVAALVLTVPAVLQLRGRWSLLRRGAGRAAAYGLVAVAGCQLFYFNAIERMPASRYLEASYYERWLTAVETLLLEKGVISREELASGRASTPAPPP